MISRGPVRSRRSRILSQVGAHAVLVLMSIIFMLPFLWMISSSLKPNAEIFRQPPTLFPEEWRPYNYVEAIKSINFFGYLINTIRYSFFATLGAVLSNSFISYGFARVRWPGREILFYITIATMMLPGIVTAIPMFVFFNRIGWVPSIKPLVVPAYFGGAFYIFMLRQFMLTLPQELDDAARIDGCSELGIFSRIVVPLIKPPIIAITLFTLLGTWNDFVGPLIYLRDPRHYTLSVGLQLYFTQHGAEWSYLMAAGTLFTLPMIILFFFAQRIFIEGITLTGIKG
ncbi:MAG: carbohydrate ABC transporter permease [Chloroflexi bacterium]|nr:carbohydrate ABC transporter permease [Chloroflexota bacterium]